MESLEKSSCLGEQVNSASHDSPAIICPPGMNRKRALISDTFKVKKTRNGTQKFGAVSEGDGRCAC